MRNRIKRLVYDTKIYGVSRLLIKGLNLFPSPTLWALKLLKFLYKVIGFLANRLSFPVELNYLLPRNNRVRRYINPKIGIEETFIILNQRNINYVILRWWEDLPSWPEGEDIDILIRDEDLDKISDLFIWSPRNQPVDIYTVSAKSSWGPFPYFSYQMADTLLRTRVKYQEHYYVPGLRAYQDSMLFHILIHKGHKSGLAFSAEDKTRFSNVEHDYEKVLSKIFVGESYPANGKEIYSYLFEKNLLPKIDTLRKLAQNNVWIEKILQERKVSLKRNQGEVLVFVIRDCIIKENMVSDIKRWFTERWYDYDLVDILILDEGERKKAFENIRGGEWGPGPFPVGGGNPCGFVVAFDYSPKKPQSKEVLEQKDIGNEKYIAKYEIRAEINRNMLKSEAVNPIHACDDEVEAQFCLKEVLRPERLEVINDKINERRNLLISNYDIEEVLSSIGSRTVIQKITYKNQKAIRKLYKLGFEDFCKREGDAYKTLSASGYTLTPLYMGTNEIILPYVIDELSSKDYEKRLLELLPYKEEIREFLKNCYDNNILLVDINPTNFMIVNKKLVVVDFEFATSYENGEKPKDFKSSYDIIGVPKNYKGAVPRGFKHPGYCWNSLWKDIFGEIS